MYKFPVNKYFNKQQLQEILTRSVITGMAHSTQKKKKMKVYVGSI